MIICNFVALFLVPAIIMVSPDSLFAGIEDRLLHVLNIRPYGEDDIYIPTIMMVLVSWGEMFKYPVKLLYSLFLLVCGC